MTHLHYTTGLDKTYQNTKNKNAIIRLLFTGHVSVQIDDDSEDGEEGLLCVFEAVFLLTSCQISPNDGAVVATREVPSNAELDGAVQRAYEAQKSWVGDS